MSVAYVVINTRDLNWKCTNILFGTKDNKNNIGFVLSYKGKEDYANQKFSRDFEFISLLTKQTLFSSVISCSIWDRNLRSRSTTWQFPVTVNTAGTAEIVPRRVLASLSRSYNDPCLSRLVELNKLPPHIAISHLNAVEVTFSMWSSVRTCKNWTPHLFLLVFKCHLLLQS